MTNKFKFLLSGVVACTLCASVAFAATTSAPAAPAPASVAVVDVQAVVNASPAVMTRQQLLLECFPDSLDTYDRIIDSHVKNIRTKLGASGFDWIGAVRGYGYRFSGSKR